MNGYFGDATGTWTPDGAQERYGFDAGVFEYGWEKFYPRFDLSNPAYANEQNRFGWVVEIDPMDGSQLPVKRTAHSGASSTKASRLPWVAAGALCATWATTRASTTSTSSFPRATGSRCVPAA